MTRDRLIFFGTDAFSVPALIRLLAEGWNVVGVVTKPDSHTGRGQQLTYPAVKRLALAKNIPVIQPAMLTAVEADLQALKPDAGIVAAYGKIIPDSTIRLFPKGLINIHASLLPRHRGASPIETAILSGDEVTGVTLMQIDTGLDTGPTYHDAKLQLVGTETRPALYEQLAEMGADLLSSKLTSILNDVIVPVPQDHGQATTTTRLQKSHGRLDWSQPAEILERQIRAHLGWPGSQTQLLGIDAIITSARTGSESGPAGQPFRTPSGELGIYTGSGSLIIDHLKPAGKREMTGPEFLAGHPLPKS